MKIFSSLRIRALWRRWTLADRIAFGVILAFVLLRAGALLGVPYRGGFALNLLFLLAVIYAVAALLPWVRRKLLWSLLNRLIVAYVFIAVVPVVLLLTMAGVASYMLYLDLGAHLLTDDITSRLTSVEVAAETVADAVARETSNGPPTAAVLSDPKVSGVIEALREDLPGLQVELGTGDKLLRMGGRERSVFAGMIESRGRLLLACVVARKMAHGETRVFASVPITSEILDGLGSEVGPIQFSMLRPAAPSDDRRFVLPLDGREWVAEHISSRHRTLAPRSSWLDMGVNGVSTLELVTVEGESPTGREGQVIATFLVRPSQMNHRLFTSLGTFGATLSVVLGIIAVAFLLLEFGALWTGVVLTRRITGAVSDLYEATRMVRRGDWSHRVHVAQKDQLGALGESFNDMTRSISELIVEQKQRQKLENEIAIAQQVQAQLFPQRLPEIPGVEMFGICRPARTVSGDYYDFIRLGPTRLALVLADISGKGLFASLLMASLQASLRSQAMLEQRCDTAKLVGRLNEQLFQNTTDDRYATMFYAEYDTVTRILCYTNAGHLAPMLLHGGQVTRLDTGGTAIGLFEQFDWEEGRVEVRPGSVLVIFTDGLTEPENVYGEEFGGKRLIDVAQRNKDASCEQIANRLIDAAEQWGGTAEQADDMTVVVARMR
ncbi:MAG: SpoIIE family protein phosphatase [Candidatus Acidiferrales bacterium]